MCSSMDHNNPTQLERDRWEPQIPWIWEEKEKQLLSLQVTDADRQGAPMPAVSGDLTEYSFELADQQSAAYNGEHQSAWQTDLHPIDRLFRCFNMATEASSSALAAPQDEVQPANQLQGIDCNNAVGFSNAGSPHNQTPWTREVDGKSFPSSVPNCEDNQTIVVPTAEGDQITSLLTADSVNTDNGSRLSNDSRVQGTNEPSPIQDNNVPFANGLDNLMAPIWAARESIFFPGLYDEAFDGGIAAANGDQIVPIQEMSVSQPGSTQRNGGGTDEGQAYIYDTFNGQSAITSNGHEQAHHAHGYVSYWRQSESWRPQAAADSLNSGGQLISLVPYPSGYHSYDEAPIKTAYSLPSFETLIQRNRPYSMNKPSAWNYDQTRTGEADATYSGYNTCSMNTFSNPPGQNFRYEQTGWTTPTLETSSQQDLVTGPNLSSHAEMPGPSSETNPGQQTDITSNSATEWCYNLDDVINSQWSGGRELYAPSENYTNLPSQIQSTHNTLCSENVHHSSSNAADVHGRHGERTRRATESSKEAFRNVCPKPSTTSAVVAARRSDSNDADRRSAGVNYAEEDLRLDNVTIGHQEAHTGENPDTRREQCEKTLSDSTSQLMEHRGSHSGQRSSAYGLSQKTFRLSRNLAQSKMTNTRQRPFSCDVCLRAFTQKESLIKHQRIHSGDKPFSCDVCLRAFSRKESLVRHQRIHSGDKPFSCDVCLRAFSQKGHLREHQRIHSGDTPFSCDVCLRAFTQKESLIKHQRIHSGDKPFSCDVCLRAFTQKESLIKHQRIHSGDKPFSCDVCLRAFSRKESLIRHQRIHNGQRHRRILSDENTPPDMAPSCG